MKMVVAAAVTVVVASSYMMWHVPEFKMRKANDCKAATAYLAFVDSYNVASSSVVAPKCEDIFVEDPTTPAASSTTAAPAAAPAVDAGSGSASGDAVFGEPSAAGNCEHPTLSGINTSDGKNYCKINRQLKWSIVGVMVLTVLSYVVASTLESNWQIFLGLFFASCLALMGMVATVLFHDTKLYKADQIESRHWLFYTICVVNIAALLGLTAWSAMGLIKQKEGKPNGLLQSFL